jgi:proteasome assembly chaperone 2
LQQRAPLFKGKRNQFAQLLIDFIKREKFREVICLTSSHAYERLDSQLVGIQCRYLLTNTADNGDKLLSEKHGWKILEKRADINSPIEPVKNLKAFIPGGGIAQKFFKLSEEQGLNNCYVLIVFAHEGNNIPEAIQLVNYLNQMKDFLNKSGMTSWRTPISWQYLFGRTIDPNTQSQIF